MVAVLNTSKQKLINMLVILPVSVMSASMCVRYIQFATIRQNHDASSRRFKMQEHIAMSSICLFLLMPFASDDAEIDELWVGGIRLERAVTLALQRDALSDRAS